jgi:hypothetical protein
MVFDAALKRRSSTVLPAFSSECSKAAPYLG